MNPMRNLLYSPAREIFASKPAAAKEHFAATFAVTESNPEEGTFLGLASVFGSMVDAWTPTVFERGAFTKTLTENGKRFRVLYQHDSTEPLARPGLGMNKSDVLRQTDQGLLIGARISQTARGKDAITLLRDKVIDELSIGHDPIKVETMPLSQVIAAGLLLEPERFSEWNHEEPVRVIKEARLWEASLVTWGADGMAKITEAHELLRDYSLEEALELLAALPAEIQKGAMLSGKNKELIKKCVDSMKGSMDSMGGSMAALQALIAAAEPPPAADKDDDEEQALTANAERNAKLRAAQLALAKMQLSTKQ